MGIKETFRKQGGLKLIKQFAKTGSLGTAIGEFLMLGKSRTALEILRLSTQLKTTQKLQKKYSKELDLIDSRYDFSLPHESSNKIWICWFQGIDNAPAVVRRCIDSIKKNITDREVIVLTDKTINKYVVFPDYIQEKIDAGIIRGAHLSDLLRLELLIKYGGTWIDATVFCSGPDIPSYMLDSELFLFQCLKPGRDGHSTVISNWFITAKSNNRILFLVRELLYKYWKNNNSLVDYFIFHDFFQLSIEKHSEEWNRVVPFPNSTPHILLLRIFEDYDQCIWDAVTGQCPFHKLSYKFENKDMKKDGTFFKHILNAE